jgi:hypothetical protein
VSLRTKAPILSPEEQASQMSPKVRPNMRPERSPKNSAENAPERSKEGIHWDATYQLNAIISCCKTPICYRSRGEFENEMQKMGRK